jgi:hypothetical protein
MTFSSGIAFAAKSRFSACRRLSAVEAELLCFHNFKKRRINIIEGRFVQ